MTKKRELSNEDLDKVAGGGYSGDVFGEIGFYGYIDRYLVQADHAY